MAGFVPEPLIFSPRLVPTLWGGRNLATYLDKDLPDQPAKIAESWEIYEQNPVLHGAYAGRALFDLVETFGTDLVGTRAAALAPGRFPLLLKFIDAQDRLSVQVHPNDEYAREHEGGKLGKTEAWYVIHAEPGAHLYVGVTSEATRERIREAVAKNTLEQYLRLMSVRAGDVVYVPAGTVHAIGRGVVLYEIQETSDVTYRLSDWGRVDANGQPRQLHVEQSLDVLVTGDAPGSDWIRPVPLPTPDDNTPEEEPDRDHLPVAPELGPIHAWLVACRYFGLELLHPIHGQPNTTDGATFHLLSTVRGHASLLWGPDLDRRLPLPLGVSVLLPATLGPYEVQAAGSATVIRARVPDLLGDVIAPLRAVGVPDERIVTLGGRRDHNDLAAVMEMG